jgi:hypothetical protein
MDADRFDLLTRSLIAPSRRGFSRALAGLGLVGGLDSLLSLADAGAKKRKHQNRKKKCKNGKKKCGKKCILKTQCCSAADCQTGATCEDGTCVCPSERAECDGACVDLASDGANCGACGYACSTDTCIHGACTCNDGADCPDECSTCFTRVEGGKVCGFLLIPQFCDTDADCPLGTACAVGIDNFCSDQCAEYALAASASR